MPAREGSRRFSVGQNGSCAYPDHAWVGAAQARRGPDWRRPSRPYNKNIGRLYYT